MDSKSHAKLSPASLEKAKTYGLGDIFEADVINEPKPKLIPQSGTPMRKRLRRMVPRN